MIIPNNVPIHICQGARSERPLAFNELSVFFSKKTSPMPLHSMIIILINPHLGRVGRTRLQSASSITPSEASAWPV